MSLIGGVGVFWGRGWGWGWGGLRSDFAVSFGVRWAVEGYLVVFFREGLLEGFQNCNWDF